MSFTLRPYQRDAVDTVISSIRAHHTRESQACREDSKRPWAHFGGIVQIGTGGGKSATCSELAVRMWRGKKGAGKRVLFLTPRITLTEQIVPTIAKTIQGANLSEFEFPCSALYGQTRAEIDGHKRSAFLSSTVQTMGKDDVMKCFSREHFSLLIVDEQHMLIDQERFQKILDWFTCPKIALSATPKLKADCKYFPHGIVYEKHYHELADEGWLVPIEHVQAGETVTIAGVKPGQELTDEQHEALQGPGGKAVARKLVEEADGHGRKTILVKCGTVKIAKDFAGYLSELGESAFDYHSDIPDEDTTEICPSPFFSHSEPETKILTYGRRSRLKQFEAGEVRFLCICDMLSVGWDCPRVDCVAITCSLPAHLYLQVVGRGLRSFGVRVDDYATPEERKAAIAASAKPNLLLVDFVFAINEHGHVLTDGFQALMAEEQTGMEPTRKEGDPPVPWSREMCEQIDTQFTTLCALLNDKLSEDQINNLWQEWSRWMEIVWNQHTTWEMGQTALLRILKRINTLLGRTTKDFEGFKKTIKAILEGQARLANGNQTTRQKTVSLLKYIHANFKKKSKNEKGKDSIHKFWAARIWAQMNGTPVPEGGMFTDLHEGTRKRFSEEWDAAPPEVAEGMEEKLNSLTRNFIRK